MTPASSFPAHPDSGAPLPGPGVAPAGRLRDALPPGTLLGGTYRIERTLGQGGFGIVYLAADLALQRPVAIKEFLPVHLALRLEGQQIGLREPAHRDAFGRGLQSFLREARLLAQFDHPSLVRVYRFWEEHQTAYMAMPYYEGPTLAAARQQMLRPPEEAWLREQLLLPLLGALQTLHEGHCLHRDVAPGNILLLPDGRPILLDFGSARRVVGDMTQPLTAIVNPAYAAIEQYAESPNLPQGPWTDLYGLACVAYFALSGRAPAPATVRAVNETALMPMAEVGQAIAQSFPGLHYGPAFLAAIDRALSLRPADRPQSAAELREALTSLHVRPDVAFEEPREAAPAFEEIRVPRDAQPPAPTEAAEAAREPAPEAEAAAQEPQDDEQAAIRANIQTALGEIAHWPTIPPRAGPPRRSPGRVEPVFGAGPDLAGCDARRAAAGKAHLTVVASAQMRDDAFDERAPQHDGPGDAAARPPLAPVEPVAPVATAASTPAASPAQSAASMPSALPASPPLSASPTPSAPSVAAAVPVASVPIASAPGNAGAPTDPREATPPTPPREDVSPATPPAPAPAPVGEPFIDTVVPADFAHVSAGEPTLGEPADAFAFDAAGDRARAWPAIPDSAPASASAAPGPVTADVVPFDVGPALRGTAEARPQPAPAPRPVSSGGQSLKAAAAVVAAALLGGGLWYAQDVGRLAWQWTGWGTAADTTSAAAGPAAPSENNAQLATAAPQAEPPAPSPQTAAAPPAAAPELATGATAAAPPTGSTVALNEPSPPAQPNPSPAPAPITDTAGTSGTGAAPTTGDTTPAVAQANAPAATEQSPAAVAQGDDTATRSTSPSPSITRGHKTPVAPEAAVARTAQATPPAAPQAAPAPPARTAKPSPKPPTRVAQAAPAYPPTARAACGDRRNFALYYCMKAQCRLQRYTHSAECVRLREDDEVE